MLLHRDNVVFGASDYIPWRRDRLAKPAVPDGIIGYDIEVAEVFARMRKDLFLFEGEEVCAK